jgi:hypothetical protein
MVTAIIIFSFDLPGFHGALESLMFCFSALTLNAAIILKLRNYFVDKQGVP